MFQHEDERDTFVTRKIGRQEERTVLVSEQTLALHEGLSASERGTRTPTSAPRRGRASV